MMPYKRLGIFLALVAINNALQITPNLPTIAYSTIFFLCFIISLRNSKPKVNFLFLLFAFACLMSILMNTIPAYFKSSQRFLSFLFMFVSISPLIYSSQLFTLRLYIFKYINYFIIGTVVISFIAKFTGIYSGIGAGGYFNGLTVHSMVMGPLAAITIVYSIWKLNVVKLVKKQKALYIGIAVAGFICLLLSASRGALVALVFSLIVLFITIYKFRIFKFLKTIIILFITMVASFNYWEPYLENILKKNEGNMQTGSMTASRGELWDYRIQELEDSPIFGIGFASAKYGLIEKSTGQIEPGTSWGVIFAQTGLFGGVLFTIIILSCFFMSSTVKDYFSNKALFIALLLFFAIHWLVEGYMLSSGDFLFFYCWLLIGIITSYKKNQKAFTKKMIIN